MFSPIRVPPITWVEFAWKGLFAEVSAFDGFERKSERYRDILRPGLAHSDTNRPRHAGWPIVVPAPAADLDPNHRRFRIGIRPTSRPVQNHGSRTLYP